jgi:putative ATPase
MDLFADPDVPRPAPPLAERMRPRNLDEILGQAHLVGPDSALRTLLVRDRVPSMILWGPPGCGKTTLARVLAGETGSRFVAFSAVTSGVKEVRQVVAEATHHAGRGQRTLLFVDEIHRFNKAQQDAFLPHVESGLLTLVGATTENPSFEVNPALRSRCRVFTLAGLDEEALVALLTRAVNDLEHGLGDRAHTLADDVATAIARVADGDARVALTFLEMAADATDPGAAIALSTVGEVAQSGKSIRYDKEGEEHFNLISALHKSIRGSDPDAALYWLARMLEGGADLLYVARRLVRIATEDVGNADPHALPLAIAAREAAHFLGRPEGELALAQAAVYLAVAPKSNAIEVAYLAAQRDAREAGSEPVPLHIRNAPTALMKELGYGEGYRYDHDEPDAFSGQRFLPPAIDGTRYYDPPQRGFEREITKRLAWFERRRRELRGEGDDA